MKKKRVPKAKIMADYARKRSGSADNGGDNCAIITYKYGWETKGLIITFDLTGHIHTFNDIYTIHVLKLSLIRC